MKDAALYPDSVSDISDNDFWNSINFSRGDKPSLLAAAVEAWRAGARAAAWRQIAAHHRQSLARQWEFERKRLSNSYDKAAARQAADVLNLKIAGWHSQTVQFKGKIDWNYNWGESSQYGFHYMGWLEPVVKKLAADGNDEGLREFLIGLVESYYAARNRIDWQIPRLHPVYYELGAWAKTCVFLPLYMALPNTGELPPRAIEAFLKLFLGFGRSLLMRQNGYRPGNWQIVGCSALFRLARTFPEFAESRAWERAALLRLREHLEKDFFSDGCHGERCWGYGFMSLSGIAAMFRAAQLTGGLGRDQALFLRAIRNGFRWFAKTLGPNELKPEYGDCRLDSGRHILDAALDFFPKGTPRHLGVDRKRSYFLEPSGYAVMRNGDSPDSAYLNVTFGKSPGGHSHPDLLNMNFWALGAPLIEEVGRFGSYDQPLSPVFRAPESHNQITLDAKPYNNVGLAAGDVLWRSTPECDYFSARHCAVPGFIVRRTIAFVKNPGYALVMDSAMAAGPLAHTIFSLTGNWHSPYPFKVLRPGAARAGAGPAMLVAQAETMHLRRTETGTDFSGGEVNGQDPVCNPYPERYWLRFRRWLPVGSLGAVGFVTLLYPFARGQPRASARIVEMPGRVPYRIEACEVLTPAGRDLFVLNPERLPGARWAGRPFRSRALVQLSRGRGRMVVG